jgi:hypothetical protein
MGQITSWGMHYNLSVIQHLNPTTIFSSTNLPQTETLLSSLTKSHSSPKLNDLQGKSLVPKEFQEKEVKEKKAHEKKV